MTQSDFSSLVSLVIALLALGGTAFTLLANRRRTEAQANSFDASASKEIAKAANLVVAPLNKRITDLEAKAIGQDKEIAGLKLELAQALRREGEYLVCISQLTEQLVSAKLDPVWRPAARKPGTGPLGRT